MKKTISIHLTGFVFNIEEGAYESLNQYLENIRQNLNNEEGCDEIMLDIESRIAELFQERISLSKEVIIQADIEEIISILGHPSEFSSENESEETQATNNTEQQPTKRLFRDRENGSLGGVCSGLGHYFDQDPLLFRILFLVLFLFFGSGILLYIILVIFVPEAKTTADKIEMRGGSVNVDSIKRHFTEIADNLRDSTKRSELKKSIRNTVDSTLSNLGSAFQVIAKIVGIAFIIGGLFLFVLMIYILFFDTSLVPFIGDDRIPDIYTAIQITFTGNNSAGLIISCIALVIGIPLISMIITGIRIITKNRTNSKQITWALSIVWSIAATLLFIYAIGKANDVKKSNQIKSEIPLNLITSNIITIDVWNDDQFSNYINPNYRGVDMELIRVDEDFIYYGNTWLNLITDMTSNEFKLIMNKSARGSSNQEAIQHAENITSLVKIVNDTIYFPPYYKFPRADKVRAQLLTFDLYIPIGKAIKFGSNFNRLTLDDSKFRSNFNLAPSQIDTVIYNLNENGDTLDGKMEVKYSN